MPYKIEYDNERLGVITVYYGTLTDEDLCGSLSDRLDKYLKLKHYRYAISDCSDVTDYKVTPEGLKKNAEIALEVSKRIPVLLMAVITPSDLMFGMGRMWETYMDDTGWKTIMVRTRKEADQWLQKHLK